MKTLVAMIGVLLSLIPQVQAGGVGNGGMAYVCRKPSTGEIYFAQLLDLWEPDHKMIIRDNERSVKEQLDRAISILGEFFPYGRNEISKAIAIDEGRTTTTNGKPLMPTADSLPTYGAKNECDFEQIAVHGYDYELRKTVLKIDEEIYNSSAFTNTDRAALKFHEALYEIARQNWNVTDSRFVRSAVAFFFSNSHPSYVEIDSSMRYAIAQLFSPKSGYSYENGKPFAS
ncbi:MAG: hypothetical protein KA715_03910 [Xanthomonadaceae bacterium]|nr:hypothetical protein [Xanthomonadaceae bacterium]